ncbi:caspase family protein [Archangium primigenium]|uniref:caspase family protein n=1 Tax=[Archangium] primigenium TaxID=2792470 RepID=UPI001959383D|nr:caspase family protein [Archangium primigenium]MBM7117690.1 caspase family protein [Archangium primigenium]
MSRGGWAGWCLALWLACGSAQAAPLRRFALVAGNDEGGADTRPLRFATEDARKLHALLVRLGGVALGDARLLLDAGPEDFLRALAQLERESAAARARGERTELLVYYSGHAKDDTLRMGTQTLGLDTLKHRLAAAPADVRIAILDACRSGRITRAKGARRAPAFSIDAGAGREARGLVLLTSSAADEDSQESDLLGGSYFTHHLLSGLMGDADRSGDGQVTLFEAYSHAYARTVADTADSGAGPQHPTFSYDLSGNGDVVLTDLRGRDEGLLVPASAPPGPYYFVNGAGLVVAEVDKAAGTERRLALAPGAYAVKRRLSDRLRVGQIEVRRGDTTVLDESRLRDAPFSDDPVKGVPPLPRPRRTYWTLGVNAGYHSVFDAPARENLFLATPLVGLEGGLFHYFREDWRWDLDVSMGTRRATLNLPTLSGPAYRYTLLTAGTSLVAEWPRGRWSPFLGARLAYLVVNRTFDDPDLPTQYYAVFTPGVVAGARWRLTDHVELTARARGHYLLYTVDARRSLGYWELGALVTYRL